MFTLSNCAQAPTLFETTDGSPKEYKNVVNLCSACFKVLTGMFEEVYLYFLPPGHSHDLQDQAWSHLKKGFYSSRSIVWNDLLNVAKRSFATFTPEVFTDIYVYDWKSWFAPWHNAIKHHSKWRAFKVFKHSTNQNAVMLMWKENEFSNEDFHGSEEHPEGIELLLQLPPGQPAQILPKPLDLTILTEVHKTFVNMHPSEKVWWEEILQTGVIPGYCTSIPPVDYFDFPKLSYAKWQDQHPNSFQQPVQIGTMHSIELDHDQGIAATGNRYFELFVGDFVTVRAEKDEFWMGKIRQINTNTDDNLIYYNVWYYEPEKESDQWSYKTVWKACKLDQPDSTANLTQDHFLTVQFKLGRGSKMKACM
jgi:hypothetical protein